MIVKQAIIIIMYNYFNNLISTYISNYSYIILIVEHWGRSLLSIDIKILNSCYEISRNLLNWFLGKMDDSLYTLLFLIMANLLVEAICAIQKRISLKKFIFHSFTHKILILILVSITNVLDIHIVKNGSILRSSTILYYLYNEGRLLLYNIDQLGLKIPSKLKDFFRSPHNK